MRHRLASYSVSGRRRTSVQNMALPGQDHALLAGGAKRGDTELILGACPPTLKTVPTAPYGNVCAGARLRAGIAIDKLALTIFEELDRRARIRSLKPTPFTHKLVLMRGAATGKNPITQPLKLKRQVGPIRHHDKHLRTQPPFYHALPGWTAPVPARNMADHPQPLSRTNFVFPGLSRTP